MSDEGSTDGRSAEELADADAVRSIRETGESADSQPDKNPPLPDWGSDGVPAEDEPEA